MTPIELFKKDRKITQDMTAKEKVKHIWHYYKWYFLALALAIFYIGSTISAQFSNSNCILNGYFLNIADVGAFSDMSETFHPAGGEQTVYIDALYFTSQTNAEDPSGAYETFQTLIAKAHAGDLDFLVVDKDTINQLIYNEFFLDLTGFLTQEQLAAYEGKLLYMDRAFLERILNLDASTDLSEPIKYPDPADPAAMEDPVPVLIDIRDCAWISKVYPFDTNVHAYGLVTNGQHHDIALQFLDFLLNGDKQQ